MQIALLHNLAIKCRFTAIRQEGSQIHVYPQAFDLDAWSELSATFGRLRVVMSGEPHVAMRLEKGDNALALLHSLFEKYIEIAHKKA